MHIQVGTAEPHGPTSRSKIFQCQDSVRIDCLDSAAIMQGLAHEKSRALRTLVIDTTMAIDLSREKLIPLTEAIKLFPRPRIGQKLHLSTIYAYTTRGKRGVVLESVQAGDIRCTSEAAVQRFFSELTRRANLRPIQATTAVTQAAAANERLQKGVFGRGKGVSK